jgi:hypothetical protein
MTTKIYQGRSTNSSDQIYTVERGRFYKGRSTNSSDEIKLSGKEALNIDGNNVYKGRSTNSSDQVITIDKLNIYKGRSTNSSEQIASIEGDRLSDSEFGSVIYLLAQRNNLIS